MAKFTVGEVQYEMVTFDKVTFAEGRAIEKVTGSPYSKLSQDASLDLMQALLWVSMRRVAPETTFDDLDDLEISVDISDDEDPADPMGGDAAEDAATTSPTSD